MTGTRKNKPAIYQSPRQRFRRRYDKRKKTACFRESAREAERTDWGILHATGSEHSGTNQTYDDHVDKNFLLKSSRSLAMPGCSAHGFFKVTIESFNIPSHMIELS
jgi:hypothetical protein